jgi:hypothetical protein
LAEYETENQPPTNFDHIVYTSLDPDKQPDPEPFTSDYEGLDQAADEVRRTRAERNVVVERAFVDPDNTSKIAPGNYSVSPEHAADALQARRDLEAEYVQAQLDAETAKAVDQFRGEQPQTEQQPQVEQPQPVEPQPEQIQPEAAPETPSEIEQLLADVAPERRQQIVRQLGQYATTLASRAQAVVQQYQKGVAETLVAAEAAALAPFVELQNVPRDQIQAVIAHIGRTDPQKHAQITAHVARVKGLIDKELVAVQNLHLQQQAQQQAIQQQREALKQFAEQQDALLEKTTWWGKESPANQAAIGNAIVDHYAHWGVTRDQVLEAYHNNPAMRHAATQELLADGIRYRMARAAIDKASARPVPKVQRPGVATEARNDYSEYATLSRQLPRDISVKQAAQLITARRNAR